MITLSGPQTQVLKLKSRCLVKKKIKTKHWLCPSFEIPWPLQTCLETLWKEGLGLFPDRTSHPFLHQPLIVFCFGMKYKKFSPARTQQTRSSVVGLFPVNHFKWRKRVYEGDNQNYDTIPYVYVKGLSFDGTPNLGQCTGAYPNPTKLKHSVYEPQTLKQTLLQKHPKTHQ